MRALQCCTLLLTLCISVVRAFSPLQSRRSSSTWSVASSRNQPTHRFILPQRFSTKQVDGETEKEDLTPSKVAEMIEVSFVNACLQLSQGYIDVLKLFIVAVQAAFNMGISPLGVVDNVGSCPVQSAGRDLMDEEVRLRTSWIHVVYLVLEYTGKTETQGIEESVRSTYTNILPLLVESKERGDTFQVERLIKEHGHILPANLDDTPMEKAIISQSLRVAWTTLIVLEEEELCKEDDAGKSSSPRPPIPGAF